jgi:hypothetical protein
LLADDDLAEFCEQRLRERAGVLDRFVDCADSCAHVLLKIIFQMDVNLTIKNFLRSPKKNSRTPSSNIQRSFNHQTSIPYRKSREPFEFGHWNFSGAWKSDA